MIDNWSWQYKKQILDELETARAECDTLSAKLATANDLLETLANELNVFGRDRFIVLKARKFLDEVKDEQVNG